MDNDKPPIRMWAWQNREHSIGKEVEVVGTLYPLGVFVKDKEGNILLFHESLLEPLNQKKDE